MCNVAGALFGARQLSRDAIAGRRVLEVGSYDVNGSLRPLLESWGPAEYRGVDLIEGPGVDEVLDATRLVERFGEGAFDVVVSTELLEHVPDWRLVISNLKRVLAPGGILLLTTRSPGYPYHGFPHDFWRYTPEDMRAIFADCELLALESDPQKPGVFLKARKPADFREAELSGLALFSVVAGKRAQALTRADYRSFYFLRGFLLDQAKRWVVRRGQALQYRG
jgi:SAM-dependent methyltransferase